MEDAFVAEIIDPQTGNPVTPGETGELVLTNLGRLGSPLVRYRTGDLVRAARDQVCVCGRSDLALEGGILGRSDDMVVVRGVNVFPSSVEEIIGQSGEVAEYRVRIGTNAALTELAVEIEPAPHCADPAALTRKIERAFQDVLSLRVAVRTVAVLPRFDMKAKRWSRD